MAKSEWESTTQLVEAAIKILVDERPMTVRQLFYRIVSKGLIENSRADYQRVSRLMTKAREDARVDFDWIVDRSRPEYQPNVFSDANEYAEVVKRGYRKDYWQLQRNYVEVWTEKDAIIGSIEPTTDELGVRIRVGRGFLSTTKAHEIAEHFEDIDKPITVFYLGDHDPSGRSIETDLAERIRGYGASFTIRRLAIFAADITKFKLPPLRVKLTDSRATDFLRRYSNRCVELDALPPTELRMRIQVAVNGLLDEDLWKRAIAVEKVELNSILSTVKMWPTL
jgi:hypothetical protein